MGEIGLPMTFNQNSEKETIYSEREISSWLKQYTKPQPSSARSSKTDKPRNRQLLQKRENFVRVIVWQ